MDFASQLANLERTAKAASASRNNEGGGGHNNDRRRGRSPTSDPQRGRNHQRPRPNNYQQQQQQRSPLEAMKRFGYRVDPPVWTPKSVHERTFPHICLLAVTIDDLPYEHIWKAWADAAASSSCFVSLVCHAKFPTKVQSVWLRQRLLLQPPRIGRGTKFDDPVVHTRSPEWGSVEITRAMKDCLQDAVHIGAEEQQAVADDPRFAAARYVIARPNNNDGKELASEVVPTVDKFIFISETCLPVTTLKECVEALFFPPSATTNKKEDEATSDSKIASQALEPLTNKSQNADDEDDGAGPNDTKTNEADITIATVDPWDVSWVNARNRNTPGTPKNKYERDQFSDIHRMIPGMHRWKADQWLVLSRRHALAVLYIDGHMSTQPADQLWNAFCKINASDEMYFPTALGVLRILKEDDTDGTNKECDSSHKQHHDGDIENRLCAVAKRPVTYTDWSEGMRNPATFSGGRRDLAKVAALARQQGCLFARKFALHGPGEAAPVTGQITVDEWNEVMAKLATH